MPDLSLDAIWQRFIKFVDVQGPDECWPWLGARAGGGYGKFWVAGKMIAAHQIALWLETGEVAKPGMVVKHSCDNPRCVNPAHLSVGTYSENLIEAYTRGRRKLSGARGEKHGRAKLTEAQAREVKALALAGELTQREIGKRYGVSGRLVSYIKTGDSWACLTESEEVDETKNELAF